MNDTYENGNKESSEVKFCAKVAVPHCGWKSPCGSMGHAEGCKSMPTKEAKTDAEKFGWDKCAVPGTPSCTCHPTKDGV